MSADDDARDPVRSRAESASLRLAIHALVAVVAEPDRATRRALAAAAGSKIDELIRVERDAEEALAILRAVVER